MEGKEDGERESGEGESMRMAAVGRGRHGEEVNLECKDRRVQEKRRGGRKAEEDGEVMPRLEGECDRMVKEKGEEREVVEHGRRGGDKAERRKKEERRQQEGSGKELGGGSRKGKRE